MKVKDKEVKVMIILLIVVLATVFIAAICFVLYNNKVNKQSDENPTIGIGNSYYQATEEEKIKASELANVLKNSLPKMDGDFSTISLEAGIMSNLTGIDIQIVEQTIYHSTEEKAFKNLLSGECDLIFTTNWTINQEREAAAKNINLTVETVANEALVFFVNAANPVESLTQEQLKGIFSGEITNWSEVGGNDAEIIVYQNAEDTMAQNFMEIFMDDVELAEPKTEVLPAINSGLIQTTATYDNSENAIGFMIYKYPSSMYDNEIKFIKVDDIEVTKQNLASHKYLLLYDIYAVYNTAKAETKSTGTLVEWLITAQGQKAVAEAGYIPIKAIEVEELSVNKYSSSGTGKEQVEDATLSNFYYTLDTSEYCEFGQNENIEEIKGLKNQELENKINQFIVDSRIQLQTVEREYEQYLSHIANNVIEGINVQTQCKNGYLCVQVLLTYQIGTISYIYDGYSNIYNLYTGEELSLSDLYYKDADFVTTLNKQIETLIVEEKGKEKNNVQMKKPFVGITDNIIYGIDMIAFKKENPYFVEGEIFELDTYFYNISVVHEENDMKDIWEENIEIKKEIVIHENNGSNLQRGKIAIREKDNCLCNIFYIDTNNGVYDEQINEKMNQYINDDTIERLIQNISSTNPNANFVTNSNNQYQINISAHILGNKYAIINITANKKPNEIELGYSITDLETGEVASQEDVQKWRTENKV